MDKQEFEMNKEELVAHRQKPDPRVETGPVVFGNDWTGLFIRGDECFNFVAALEREVKATKRSLEMLERAMAKIAEEHRADSEKLLVGEHIHLSRLQDLLRLLKSTDERVKTDREVPAVYEMPKRIS